MIYLPGYYYFICFALYLAQFNLEMARLGGNTIWKAEAGQYVQYWLRIKHRLDLHRLS